MTAHAHPLRRNAERNRERIMAAAGEILTLRELRFRLNDVAHRADLGLSTMYPRFADKRHLLDARVAQRADELVAI